MWRYFFFFCSGVLLHMIYQTVLDFSSPKGENEPSKTPLTSSLARERIAELVLQNHLKLLDTEETRKEKDHFAKSMTEIAKKMSTDSVATYDSLMQLSKDLQTFMGTIKISKNEDLKQRYVELLSIFEQAITTKQAIDKSLTRIAEKVVFDSSKTYSSIMKVQKKSQKVLGSTSKPDLSIESLMKHRQTTIREQCQNIQQHDTIEFDDDFWNLRVLPAKSLLYCPVFHSDATRWFENLVRLSGENVKGRFNNWRDAAEYVSNGVLKPISSKYTAPSAPSFIVVQHPFTRLVSAFREKLERIDEFNKWHREIHGQPMVKLYREKAKRLFGERYFTKEYNYGARIMVESPGRREEEDNLPIFWEFAQYIINTHKDDEYWRPIYRQCPMCSVKYNYVLKKETLHEEEAEFFKKFGWHNMLKPAQKETYENNSTRIMELYLDDLTDDEVVKLYEVYKYDFLLFGYSFKRGDLELPSNRNREAFGKNED